MIGAVEFHSLKGFKTITPPSSWPWLKSSECISAQFPAQREAMIAESQEEM
jgi:hypothetical protein